MGILSAIAIYGQLRRYCVQSRVLTNRRFD